MISPSTTVNPKTTFVSPCSCQAAPGPPSRTRRLRGPCPTHERLGHALRAGDQRLGPHLHCGGVGEHDGPRVEQREQALEVAVAGGLEERLDDLAVARLPGRVGLLHPSASAAGQLTSGRGGATDDRRDVVERHREQVVQHEGETLGRRQPLEHDVQGALDRVGELGLELRVALARAVDGGVVRDVLGELDASRRLVRDRSMSRHTRLTTVVSQPPRLLMPSVRCSRSQVSWTASSASWVFPSIR